MPSPTFADVMGLGGLTPFPEQLEIAEQTAEAHSDERIALIEAPTGSGKTYNIAFHGLSCALGGNSVIAVPTIELIFQTMQAIKSMQASSSAFAKLKVTSVLGRNEFLSEVDLLAAFEKSDRLPLVEGWIAHRAPGAREGEPAWTRHGLRHHLEQAGVPSDLPSGIELQTDDTQSDANRIYIEQFEQGADLVVATHAMVAIDLMVRYFAAARWQRENYPAPDSMTLRERLEFESQGRIEAAIENAGRLPDYQHLVVDEAHVFADNVRNVLSHGISLTSLGAAIYTGVGKKVITSAVASQFGAIRTQLKLLAAKSNNQRERIDWKKTANPHTKALDQLCVLLGEIKPAKLKKLKDEERFAIQRAAKALREGRASRGALSTEISWSPVNHFPSISVGKSNVRPELEYFWSQLRSAVLISATVYTLDNAGVGSTHIRSELSLPEDLIENRPITGDWLYQNVTLKLPAESRYKQLQHESISNPRSRNRWFDRQAEVLAETLQGSQERSLILTTSLDATKRIAAQLEAALPDHLVIAGNGKSLSEAKSMFMCSPAGKPVTWVAQGPAWVGLDLPDNKLDRLYIMKLPMAPPASGDRGPRDFLRNRRRMHIQLKQGIGRLVRSRQPSPKSLWCLDPSYSDPKFAVGPIFERYHYEFF